MVSSKQFIQTRSPHEISNACKPFGGLLKPPPQDIFYEGHPKHRNKEGYHRKTLCEEKGQPHWHLGMLCFYRVFFGYCSVSSTPHMNAGSLFPFSFILHLGIVQFQKHGHHIFSLSVCLCQRSALYIDCLSDHRSDHRSDP